MMSREHTHGPRNLALADGSKGEVVPVVFKISHSLSLAIQTNGGSLDGEILLEVYAIANDGRSRRLEDSSRRRHIVKSKVGQNESKSATG